MTKWLRMTKGERRWARERISAQGWLQRRQKETRKALENFGIAAVFLSDEERDRLADSGITVQPERKGWFRRFLDYMGYRDEVG